MTREQLEDELFEVVVEAQIHNEDIRDTVDEIMILLDKFNNGSCGE